MSRWSVIVPEEATNRVLNPSAERSGNFTAEAGTTVTRETTESLYGRKSYRVQCNANNEGVELTLSSCANAIHYVTLRVTGTLPSAWDISLDDANWHTTTNLGTEGTWTLYGAEIPAAQANGSTKLSVHQNGAGSGDFYIDGVQVEEAEYWTTYTDGDQTGCEWNGSAHGSTSTRSAQTRYGGRVFSFPDDYNVKVEEQTGVDMTRYRHLTKDASRQPGAILQAVKEMPRLIQLSAFIYTSGSDAEADKFTDRDDLIDALKPDLVATLQPVTLRWEGDEVGAGTEMRNVNFFCYYDSGLDGPGAWRTRDEFRLRMICYDPLGYGIGEEAEPLPVSQSLSNVQSAAARRSGEWTDMTPGVPTLVNSVRQFALAPDKTVYMVGDFRDWAGIAGAYHVASWDGTTWARVGGAIDFNQQVKDLIFAPDGTLYVVGAFTNCAGDANADYIAQWDGSSWSAVSGGGTNDCNCVEIAADGNIYIGGVFANWNGIANADGIVKWDGSAYSALGAGTGGGTVYGMAVHPNGDIWITGTFNNCGGVAAADKIAYWDGSAWNAAGSGLGGGDGVAIVIDGDGTVYVAGTFTTADGVSANRIAKWNGNTFEPLGDGFSNTVDSLVIGPDGVLYAGVQFQDRIYRWNGYTWGVMDFDPPGAPQVLGLAIGRIDPVDPKKYDIYVGIQTQGVGIAAEVTTVTNDGSRTAYPEFRLYNSGSTSWATLESIRNNTTGKEMQFDLTIMGGEEISIDLRGTEGEPVTKTVSSDYRQNIIGDLYPASDFSSFGLLPGDNDISVLVTGDPEEAGDNNNQLSDWDHVNGVSEANTDRGIMYVSIVADGGGFYHVDLYRDSGRAAGDLVGHTGTYNGAGTETITEDNGSGLGGQITIDAVVGADVDIEVYYTVCNILWRETFHGISGAIV